MSFVLAVDADVLIGCPWGEAIARRTYDVGGKLIWISMNSELDVRRFERSAGIREAKILTNSNALSGLGPLETHCTAGEVAELISNKDESLMLLFYMVLPCDQFRKFEGPQSFGFLYTNSEDRPF